MGGARSWAGGRAGVLIPEGPGASEEAPRGVPVKREGRNVKCNLYRAVLSRKACTACVDVVKCHHCTGGVPYLHHTESSSQ